MRAMSGRVRILTAALAAVLALFLCAGVAKADVTETFDVGVLTVLDTGSNGGSTGDNETPKRMDTSGFTWGAYAGNSQTTQRITVEAANYLQFGTTASGPNYNRSANHQGCYAYGIFSSTGTNTPDTFVNNIDQGGSIIVNVKSLPPTASPEKIQFLIRDKNGAWFLSTAATQVSLSTTGSTTIPFSTLAWQGVGNYTDMNELDNQGEVALTTASATPDFSQIGGGGIYINMTQTLNPNGESFGVESITWQEQTPVTNGDTLLVSGVDATATNTIAGHWYPGYQIPTDAPGPVNDGAASGAR